MSEAKFTPGPWAVADYNIHQVIAVHDGPDIDGRHQHTICNTSDEYSKARFDEQSANARLIAAAPDLLAACRAALATHSCETSEPGLPTLQEVESVLLAAIAKAEGRS